jgi:hypothetical protein
MEIHRITIPVVITVTTNDPKRVAVDFFAEKVRGISTAFSDSVGDVNIQPKHGEITSEVIGEEGEPETLPDEID